MIDYSKPIPTIQFPKIENYDVLGLSEEIVDLYDVSDKIYVRSAYFNQGIPGAPQSCYLRSGVADKLVKATEFLPDGYAFLVWDGWRPYAVQLRLWKLHRYEVALDPKNAGLSDEEIDFKTSFFVSKPVQDVKHTFLHNTGACVDLTLVKDGELVDMGTEFDDFTNRAWSNHFEDDYEDREVNDVVRDNRRILYNVMIEAGFVNLPSEWWHYGYGDKFWAYFTGKTSLYYGELCMNVPCFPLE